MRQERPEGEFRYTSTLSLTSMLDGSRWLPAHPGRLTPGNKRSYGYLWKIYISATQSLQCFTHALYSESKSWTLQWRRGLNRDYCPERVRHSIYTSLKCICDLQCTEAGNEESQLRAVTEPSDMKNNFSARYETFQQQILRISPTRTRARNLDTPRLNEVSSYAISYLGDFLQVNINVCVCV